MGLLAECPKCKIRSGLKKVKCKCGFAIKKAAHKVYWIEYYLDGRRKRERIGPSKSAAENKLRNVLKARTEEKYIDVDKAAKIKLEELCSWYISLPEVKANKTYDRIKQLIENLKRHLGATTKIRDITAGKMESYQQKRLLEKSPVHPEKNIRPATVNRELSCMKTILNRAVRHGKLDVNLISKVKKLPENNIRMRVLSLEEFENLLAACSPHLHPVVLTAYYTGMRRAEILNLTWDEVDLKSGFIRLGADRTKTKVARSVPLHPRVKKMLGGLPRGLHTSRVFLLKGKPFDDIKRSYPTACKKAGIEDFTFHDLRHCAINNLRQAGNDYFRIMAVSGHKTMSVFKRYNLVTEEELSNVKWHDRAATLEKTKTTATRSN